MRVLVVGGTGVIGEQLVPLLTTVGHDVFVLTRGDQARIDRLKARKARPVVGDLLDAAAVRRIVSQTRPDAIVHMATAIPSQINPKRQAAQFEVTNKLRTDGLRNLVDAAQDLPIERLIVQGLAYAYDPDRPGIAREGDDLWLQAPKQFRPIVDALVELESITAEHHGLVLRFGHLYGPGSFYAADGSFTAQVRSGKVPLVGGGNSVFSFIHAHDAATAVVAALDKPATGVLNVVDDDPAPMHDWLVEFANILGAKRPRSVPEWLARMAVGPWGVAYMTRLRGAENSKAKVVLDWKPRFASWRAGLVEEHRTVRAS